MRWVYYAKLSIVLMVLQLSFLVASKSFAHELSNGYLTLSGENTRQLEGRLSLMPYDLEIEVKLDENFDGDLTWQEVKAAQPGLHDYAASVLRFTQQETLCRPAFKDVAMESISGIDLIAIPFTLTCPTDSALVVSYQGVFDMEESHKTLLTAIIGGASHTDVFTRSHRESTLATDSGATAWQTITTFVYQGIIHIWIGIDHILFLLATLLTVNLVRKDNRWLGEERTGTILKSTLWLVTAFTVAHSVTLTTTALGWYQPSSRWVEFGIAISVMLTALNNIWPVIHRLVLITFAFGLLHGMGFASVFGELQANAASPLLAIASFNIGVEIGQLVVVLLLLPVLLALRHVRAYASAIMPLASSVIALIALNWAIQRF
ncbi:HupE/UreJ family protein [Alteromonas confluentis]|uniref:HupE / UreJ protein n=1 Tax=Alteromonas confluentis TaxID=1656094 RepID=A0A1E7Z926_9ALTE|nr:HupE/UreJ family protein [Alteromonas confluentis]OFC69904.1 hypothetical protein BFC18_00420 [Alteromonas confluentis]